MKKIIIAGLIAGIANSTAAIVLQVSGAKRPYQISRSDQRAALEPLSDHGGSIDPMWGKIAPLGLCGRCVTL